MTTETDTMNDPAVNEGTPKKAKEPFTTGMLSFARSVSPSEGLLSAYPVGSDRSVPIVVRDKGVRGQSSEYKTDNPGKSNPQVVESAVVPMGCDRLALTFSLQVFPNSARPWACGDASVVEAHADYVRRYSSMGGFDVLALLHVWNIANARALFRNRWSADRIRVIVDYDGKRVEFDPSALDLATPATLDDLKAAVVGSEGGGDAETLVAHFAKGLSRERTYLEVEIVADVPEGHEVYPSQEYLGSNADTDKGRVYAKLPSGPGRDAVDQASMHSQKIGAALRHIDVWHGREGFGPIAVNPYGGVQETGDVLRDKKGRNDFYTIRNRRVDELRAALDVPPDAPEAGIAHFFVANLVRGGVFGQKGGE